MQALGKKNVWLEYLGVQKQAMAALIWMAAATTGLIRETRAFCN